MLSVSVGDAKNEWPIWVVQKRDFARFGLDPSDSATSPPRSLLISGRGDDRAANTLHLHDGEGTIPMPFWREAAYVFAKSDGFWDRVPFADRWERLLAVSPDSALDMDHLVARYELSEIEVLMKRIDTRSYKEHPIMIRAKSGGATMIATTLRPFGGLGIQPSGLAHNPAGSELIWCLLQELEPR
mgnify:CR=1 FL=1